jgi:hypothetical protein
MEGPGSEIRIRMLIQEAQKHMDLTDPDADPDPEH